MKSNDTAVRLLDAAQTLVQERGFNAFSYADLADEVGIRTASIHYHFPGKAELGTAMMERYLAELGVTLDGIDRRGRSHAGRLRQFIASYRGTEKDGRICLCGSLAADLESLPDAVQELVTEYLDRSEAWVAAAIADGVSDGEFDDAVDPKNLAALLVSSLQGSLIVSRARGGASSLNRIERAFFASLGAK